MQWSSPKRIVAGLIGAVCLLVLALLPVPQPGHAHAPDDGAPLLAAAADADGHCRPMTPAGHDAPCSPTTHATGHACCFLPVAGFVLPIGSGRIRRPGRARRITARAPAPPLRPPAAHRRA